MGLGLVLGALSGAGQGISQVADEQNKMNYAALQNHLDIQKAQAIADYQTQINNQQREALAGRVAGAAAPLNQQTVLANYQQANPGAASTFTPDAIPDSSALNPNASPSTPSTGTTTAVPVSYVDLTPEQIAKYAPTATQSMKNQLMGAYSTGDASPQVIATIMDAENSAAMQKDATALHYGTVEKAANIRADAAIRDTQTRAQAMVDAANARAATAEAARSAKADTSAANASAKNVLAIKKQAAAETEKAMADYVKNGETFDDLGKQYAAFGYQPTASGTGIARMLSSDIIAGYAAVGRELSGPEALAIVKDGVPSKDGTGIYYPGTDTTYPKLSAMLKLQQSIGSAAPKAAQAVAAPAPVVPVGNDSASNLPPAERIQDRARRLLAHQGLVSSAESADPVMVNRTAAWLTAHGLGVD